MHKPDNGGDKLSAVTNFCLPFAAIITFSGSVRKHSVDCVNCRLF